MRRATQGRQRIARLFCRKRWHFRHKCCFGLPICLRSDTILKNRCRKRRFRINGLRQIVGQASLKSAKGLHVRNVLMLAERAFQ